MKLVFLTILISLQLFSSEMRNCTLDDLLGHTWIVSHHKVFDKNADKTPGSYLSYFLQPLQLLRYLENGELRSVYSDIQPKDNKFDLSIKLLNYPQGDLFYIDEQGIITIKRTNGKFVEQMSCKVYVEAIAKSNIAKGSIYLLRYNGSKPLVGNVYQVIPSDVIENIKKKTTKKTK
jgi:hypothetical protein